MKIKNVRLGILSCLCIWATVSVYHPTKVAATKNMNQVQLEDRTIDPSFNSGMPTIDSKMSSMNSTLVPRVFGPDIFKADFAHDKIGAERWAKEHFNRWKNDLSSGQVKLFDELKTPAKPDEYHINRELKATGGDINRRAIDEEGQTIEKEKTERYKREIDTIDKALRNTAGKTSNKMYVYKDMKLEDLNQTKETELVDSINPNIIDIEKLKDFKNNFNYGISSDYLIVNLSERQGGNNGILKWRIELPAGTHAGHLDEDRLVLQRNQGLEISGVTVINQKGKEYIRINAKLVTRDKINEKIQRTQSDLNKSWNEALGLPESTEFIKFELNDRYASSVIEGARAMLHEMGSNVPNNVIKNAVHYMLEKNGGFIFTDNGLGNLPESYHPADPTKQILDYYNNSKGSYNPENGTLILNGIIKSINGDVGMSSGPFIHEFGHVVDNLAAKHIGSKAFISESAEFEKIFQKEMHNLTPYAKSNEQAFFAEAFRMRFSNDFKEREKLETDAPETSGFINDNINKIDSMLHYEKFKDIHTATEWGNKAFLKWKHELKQDEIQVITEYTKNANPINSYLRENDGNLGSDPVKDQKIGQMDKALDLAKVSHNMIVYRGTDGIIFGEKYQGSLMNGNKVNAEVAAEIKEKFTGTHLTERGYLSTSLLNETQFMARPVLIELKVPEGTSAAYVDPISYYPGQFELLFSRNTQYRIDNIIIIDNNGNQKLKVEATILK
ncbi:ADP-ribosyltransferase [Bacillus wiedmannii]|uniref:ADP-ribosyltransferase n=1 Tax=Bacillus wiedmannii TaxID=1890302 RepID=UPI000B4530FA